MPNLPLSPTLRNYQDYVAALEDERGFADQNIIQKTLMLVEEVGELCKSIRKQQNMPVEDGAKVSPAAEEMADILIMLCSVANRLDIDLEQAFRNKEEINKNRQWKKQP